jgi:hypothetical protein
MAYDVRLATRISPAVDRRLRMLALVQSRALSHVLDALLDRALPPADELAALLGADRHAESSAPSRRPPGTARNARTRPSSSAAGAR